MRPKKGANIQQVNDMVLYNQKNHSFETHVVKMFQKQGGNRNNFDILQYSFENFEQKVIGRKACKKPNWP